MKTNQGIKFFLILFGFWHLLLSKVELLFSTSYGLFLCGASKLQPWFFILNEICQKKIQETKPILDVFNPTL